MAFAITQWLSKLEKSGLLKGSLTSFSLLTLVVCQQDRIQGEEDSSVSLYYIIKFILYYKMSNLSWNLQNCTNTNGCGACNSSTKTAAPS